MANRSVSSTAFAGGDWTWDATAGTKWATTPGGVGGQTAPGSGDVARLDFGTGTITRTVATGLQGLQLTTAGITLAGTTSYTIGTGGLLVSAGTWSATGGVSCTATQTVTLNGYVLSSGLTVNGAGITVTLGSSGGTNKIFTITNGSLNLAGFVLSVAALTLGASVGTITFGGGSIALTATGNGAGITGTAGTATLVGTPTVNITTAGFNTTVATGNNAFEVTLSGAGTSTITGVYGKLNYSASTGTIAMGTGGATVYGDVTFPATGGAYTSSATNTLSFNGTGTQLFSPGVATIPFPITYGGTGTLRLSGSGLDMSARTFTHGATAGTLDLNGLGMTCNVFSSLGGSAITSGGSTGITISGTSSSFATSTTSSVNCTDALIVTMGSSTSKTFASVGSTNITLVQGGTGELLLNGASNGTSNVCTLYELKGTTISFVTVPTTTVLTVQRLNLNNGTLRSGTAGTPFSLVCASGTIRLYNQTIKDCAASGGATFLAYTSDGNVDGGGNTGWQFTASAASTVSETVTPTDAQSAANASSDAVTEAASPTDAQSAANASSDAVTEAASPTDAQSAANASSGAVTEAASPTDAQSAANASSGAVTETIPVTDTSNGGISVSIAVYPDGTAASALLGEASERGSSNVYPLGVQASGIVAGVLVWGQINEGQTPNWGPVNDSQPDNWVQIADGNTVVWAEIPT